VAAAEAAEAAVPPVASVTAGPEEEHRQEEAIEEQDRRRGAGRQERHRATTGPRAFPDSVHLNGRTYPSMSCLSGGGNGLRSGSLENLVLILSGPLGQNGA
jgi:hypothetical protein